MLAHVFMFYHAFPRLWFVSPGSIVSFVSLVFSPPPPPYMFIVQACHIPWCPRLDQNIFSLPPQISVCSYPYLEHENKVISQKRYVKQKRAKLCLTFGGLVPENTTWKRPCLAFPTALVSLSSNEQKWTSQQRCLFSKPGQIDIVRMI